MSSDDPIEPPPSQRVPLRNELSRLLTIVLAVLLACALFCIRSPVEGAALIDPLASPERVAMRVFERDLEVEEAAARLAGWQRELLAAALESEPGDAHRAAIEAYRKVLARPLVRKALLETAPAARETTVEAREFARAELRARLAVLIYEDGRADDAASVLAENEQRSAAFEVEDRERVARASSAIQCAYHPAPCATAYAAHDLALFSPGWALDRLRLRLARASTEDSVVRELESAAEQRADRLRAKLLAFASAFALPLVLGIGALLAWLWRGRPLALSTPTPIPPAWTFTEGSAVLVRAAAAGIAISVLLVLAGHWLGSQAPAASVTLFASLPMLWLVRRRLLAPHALGFAQAFGLSRLRGNARAWIAWTLGLFAVGEIGTRLIRFACTAAGADVHWSQTTLEGLLSSDATTAWLDALDAGVWAPFFEEVGCRGLLYLTLRRRSGPLGAALASALVFGALHQSSLPFFLIACWYGLVWAVAFERTRSLWPAIVGHALTNVFVVGAGALFYR